MKSVRFKVDTSSRTQMIDITERVQRAVEDAGLDDGLCCVYVPHTTAAVTINEDADPSVVRDICMVVDELVPWEGGYAHAEGNSAAHVKSSLVGCSIVVPVEGGRLLLGRWQGIYFCEFDGPRSREVMVKPVGG